jgi:hypothetical protein
METTRTADLERLHQEAQPALDPRHRQICIAEIKKKNHPTADQKREEKHTSDESNASCSTTTTH